MTVHDFEGVCMAGSKNALRKLNRAELLQMLVAVTEENELLKSQLEELKREREDAGTDTDSVSSLSQAAAELESIFATAQKAVKVYTGEIERLRREPEADSGTIISEARTEAQAIISRAEEDAANIRRKAEMYMSETMAKARRKYDKRTEFMSINSLERNDADEEKGEIICPDSGCAEPEGGAEQGTL